jgi:NADH-quinone oxidoreductase subunit G
METVSLTIDGRAVTVEKGKTVLQAAIENGITVPYYCYHPGIGMDGSCRVCVVKIEKMPKLQTSCSTVCADGMVVHTRSEDVVAARAGVFEFLLVNHPLDCPVCDKGGECPLQDFSYTFGPDESRMEFPRRVFDGEGARADVDFGPTLMLNRNRCILCTRCVRFMRDVDNDAQINIIDRGYGSEIATFREEGVHSLLSGNLVDICPVGAITARDYRFKSRPWDNTNVVDTTCTFCAKGCNTTSWLRAKPEWAKGSQLVRITPRHNPSVNGYWMCDIGRWDYHWVESDARLRRPTVKDALGAQRALPWDEAMDAVASRLKKTSPDEARFLLSAHCSLEELFVASQLIQPAAITISWRVAPKEQPANTTFKVPAVDAPNVNGARLLGLAPGAVGDPQGEADVSRLRSEVESGRVQALFVLDPGPEGSIGDLSWLLDARRAGRLPLLIVQAALESPLTREADVVLPGASSFEKDASYCNEQGMIQAAAEVIAPLGEAREDWRILCELAVALGVDLSFASSDEVRRAIGAARPDSAEALAALTFARPVNARHWLQTSNPSERWKWDALYQDVPPTKFSGEPFSTNFGYIPLTEVK